MIMITIIDMPITVTKKKKEKNRKPLAFDVLLLRLFLVWKGEYDEDKWTKKRDGEEDNMDFQIRKKLAFFEDSAGKLE